MQKLTFTLSSPVPSCLYGAKDTSFARHTLCGGPQAADIQGRVAELMLAPLTRAADTGAPLQPADLMRLAATVRVLEALAPVREKN